jgi:antitoxin ParD1/3/4
MPTRNVVITDHQATMIEKLVRSGRYQNASEVLREGLRLLERRDADFETHLTALREAAKIGWDDIEAGRYRSFKTRGVLRSYLNGLIKDVVGEPTE